MRPARAVFGGDIRPLHVKTNDCRMLGPGQCLCALGKAFKRGRDERRQKTGHTRPAHLLNRAIHVFRRGQGVIEVHAAKAVDLEIEQSGEFNSHNG